MRKPQIIVLFELKQYLLKRIYCQKKTINYFENGPQRFYTLNKCKITKQNQENVLFL